MKWFRPAEPKASSELIRPDLVPARELLDGINAALSKQAAASESLLQQVTRSIQQLLMVEQDIARQALLGQPRYTDPKRLSKHEEQGFSQSGQDGIIAEIFKRIGTDSRVFVEIGCGNGLENNTAYLLTQGWKGFWFEGGPAEADSVRIHCRASLSRGDLQLIQAMMTKETIAELFMQNRVPPVFDLLSIDVDRNTFFLLEALGHLRPRVIVAEYNSSILPGDDWVVEYDPAKFWNGSNYYGASLKALERLMNDRDYHLVGCDLAGLDAFFVRKDLCGDKFCSPYTAENHFEPQRYHLLRAAGHPRCFGD